MLGAIIGDVVGSRFEFDNIKTKKFTLVTSESSYTDDTVLTIAVMDWLLHAKDKSNLYEAASFLQKWAKKYPYAGYGTSFITWMDLENPKPYNSCGNGSAMRISAVGWFAKNEEELQALTKTITEVTHNHKEGLKGAYVTAKLVYMALHNSSKEELKNYAISEYPKIKDLDYETLRKTYVHGAEICQVTVPEAIYCFLISTSFEDTLRTTISIGGDCDTTSAISCAIAEAYYQDIDKNLVKDVRAKLTREMLEVIDEFSLKVKNN